MKDIADFLDVVEDERLDVDPDPVYNADAGFDIDVVSDGDYVELDSASSDEPLASDHIDEDDDLIVAPEFLTAREMLAADDEEED